MSKLTLDRNALPIQVLRPYTTGRVSISGTAAASSAVSADARVLRVVSNTDCFYAIGSTATTSSVYLPAGMIEYLHVFEGDTVSFITSGASGYAYATEMV